jgi:hypothetical protein
MPIGFVQPLVRAWHRMVEMLFRPFDGKKWLILAFTAWVAGLLDGGGGGGGGTPGGGGDGHGSHPGGPPADPAQILEGCREACTKMAEGAHWVLDRWPLTLLIFVGLPLLLILVLTVVWLSSRFKLIYLDNVVRNRAAVREPWRRLRKLGDSLFLFRVGFGLAAALAGIVVLGGLIVLGIGVLATSKPAGIAILIFVGLVICLYIVALIYAKLFLHSFVVPIMYHRNVTVLEAWRQFLPLFHNSGLPFVLYGLFVLALFIATGMAIGLFGLLTCCIGLLILWLPYVGTLLLLPLLVTYRLLSLEFLAQFGPELNVLALAPQPENAAASAAR